MQLLLIPVVLLLFGGCKQALEGAATDQTATDLATQMGAQDSGGFAHAVKPRPFRFPRDHGAHPEFAMEWWYFTGNLHTDAGRRFGYQLTLFRVGLEPGPPVADSDWRANQVYMGHLAISDVAHRRHHARERFARAAAGLAGATVPPLKIWLGPWSIRGGTSGLFPIEIEAAAPEMALRLSLQAGDKVTVLQGEAGLSRKGPGPGNASYYYSHTRLPTDGEIRVGQQRFEVSGNSWFDREWSSSALAADQAGWDWFALQLDDGSDLMFYRMRDNRGSAQPFSSGSLVDPAGRVTRLSLEEVEIRPTRYWKSQQGTRYPVAWHMRIPSQDLDLRIEAVFDDQEMALTVTYWEGAVNISGNRNGVGYMELSGYAP